MATRGNGDTRFAGSGGVASATIDDPFSVSAGQLVICGVCFLDANVTAAVTDNASQTYTGLTKVKHSSHNQWVQIFYKENHPGNAALAPVVTFTGGTPDYATIRAQAYTLGITSGAFTAEASGQVSASTTATTGDLVATASGVIFAAANLWNSGTFTAGTNMNLLSADGSVSGFVDRLISGAGTYQASIVESGGDDILIVAALFQDSAGALTVKRNTLMLMGLGR